MMRKIGTVQKKCRIMPAISIEANAEVRDTKAPTAATATGMR